MAIAANFRKYPQALALQMPLPFGRLLRWATSRPTTTVLRAIRAERGRTFAELIAVAAWRRRGMGLAPDAPI